MALICQAVILAGGRGTRLGNLTRTIPKPMIAVNGKPFLEWFIMYVSRYGIKRFIISSGYRAEYIKDYFGDGSKWNVSITHSVENTPLGTGGALKKAMPLLEKTFLVLNGDALLDFDGRNFLSQFDARSRAGMLAVWKNDSSRFRSNVRLDPSASRVTHYSYLSPSGKTHVDCGTKIFSRALFDFFDNRTVFSLEEDVMPKMARRGLLAAYPVQHLPFDIGTPEELETTRRLLSIHETFHASQ